MGSVDQLPGRPINGGIDGAAPRVALSSRIGLLDYPKAQLRMRCGSAGEAHHRLQACSKEPWTVEWIESMAPGEVLYDVGASTGPYSLVAASRGVRVFAFEPYYASYARLVENATMNNLGSLLTPFPIALSSRTGLGVMNCASRMPGAAGHTFWVLDGSDEAAPRVAPLLQQLVLGFRADDLPGYDARILPPNHIKLDVDGAEAVVLAGAKGCLAAPGFRSLMVELEGERGEALIHQAAGLGLRLAELFDGSTSTWMSINPSLPRSAYGLFRRAT